MSDINYKIRILSYESYLTLSFTGARYNNDVNVLLGVKDIL